VAHTRRWHLALPDLAATRAYLAAGLAETLALLEAAPESDAGLYFYRLALFHEDMHGEAGMYMAQALDIPLPENLRPQAARLPEVAALRVSGQEWTLGWQGAGFAFDNELAAHPVTLDAFEIDSQPVSWRRYLACVEATQAAPPRYLRRAGQAWEVRRFGAWQALDLDTAAVHLTRQEAESWCRWAGRRLPS
jgi:iron(II)-dependent oxidoreductase